MRTARFHWTAPAIASALALLACGGSGSPTDNSRTTPPPPPPNTVVVGNNSFTPRTLTVPVGTKVTWNWDTCSGGDGYGGGQTCVDHSVTFDDGVTTGSATQSTGSFALQFNTAGTYAYHCVVHGSAMTGAIVVQ